MQNSPARNWVAKVLMLWFQKNKRQLPWRADRDPYRIWISEVMLQQTQVETVIPYFHRFLKVFPTMEDLARAKEDEVLLLWQGLGYYRRARNLHRAAKILWEKFSRFPNSLEELKTIPGLGRYTRNAVLSQAFNLPLPIVEANSQRVLARLFALNDPIDSSLGIKKLWQAAEDLLHQEAPGEFNQALMELGALVCTKNNPLCQHCPLMGKCLARLRGLQDKLPVKKIKPKTTTVQEAAILLARQGKVLLGRRPEGVRWERMWEIPHGLINPGESLTTAGKRITRELTSLQAVGFKPIGRHSHSVTRYRIEVDLLQAHPGKNKLHSNFYLEFAWVDWKELDQYALGSAQRRLLTLWRNSHNENE